MIGVSAVGPSQKKADYSNYGAEQISVAAPGGWFRDGFGTDTFRTNGNLILSTYPKQGPAGGGHGRRRRQRRAGGRRPGVQGLLCRRCLRVLHLPAGHLDGVAARGRRRGARGEQVRAQRRAGPGSGSSRTGLSESSSGRPPSTPARVRLCRPTPTRDGQRSSTRSARAPPTSTGSTATASSMPSQPLSSRTSSSWASISVRRGPARRTDRSSGLAPVGPTGATSPCSAHRDAARRTRRRQRCEELDCPRHDEQRPLALAPPSELTPRSDPQGGPRIREA